MPGLGAEPTQSVNAGIAAQPLVTPIQPAVNPSAIEMLSDAFRKGYITSQDIHNTIGEVGQARKKAELTTLGEAVSPESVAARKNIVEAAGAKAQLESAQAGASQENVPGAAALSGEQIAAQRALLPAQTALTGKQLELNSQFLYPKAIYDIATSRLKGTPVESVDPKTGTPFKQFRNELGEDVTPPAGNYPGSEDYHRYSQLAQRAFSSINLGQAQTAPVQPAVAPQSMVQPISAATPAQPATPASAPAPSQSQFASEAAPVDQQRADLLNSGKFDAHEVTTMSDADVIDTHKQLVRFLGGSQPAALPASSLVQPAQSAQPASQASTPPTIEPLGTQPQGIQTGMSKNFMSAPDIGADLRKQKSYELWDTQKGFAHSFETTADRINQIPIGEQRSGKAKMNALDIALAESIIKMYDPGMAIREFKWDKLAEAQPYLEKLPNWRATFLHTGALTPEGRQRLIQMGYENIQGKEAALKPHLELAAQRAQSSGLDPKQVLNPDELRVLQGSTFGKPPGVNTGTTTPAQGRTGTIPGLGTGVYNPKTGIFTTQ